MKKHVDIFRDKVLKWSGCRQEEDSKDDGFLSEYDTEVLNSLYSHSLSKHFPINILQLRRIYNLLLHLLDFTDYRLLFQIH